MGNSFLERLQSGAMEKIMYACGIVGLMAIGGMVATLIGITTPLTFSEGTVVLQDILNGIVPMVLDLGAVMGMYYLIKRNVKTTWMLAICILGGIALSAFGLLA